MASKKENNFKNRLESNTRVGGLSKGQVSLHRILHTLSTVPPPPPPRPNHNYLEEVETPVFNDEQTEKKVLLGIDLIKNLAQDNDCDSPPAKISGGSAVSTVVESKKVSSFTVCDLNLKENQEVSLGKNEIQIQYCSEVETSGIDEKDRKKQNARWEALLKVAEIYSRKLEEERAKDGRQTHRRRTSGKVELQIESRQHRTKNQSENVKVVEAELLAPPVVRSNRGSTQALPYKFRDSIVDSWTELSQQNKSSKSSPMAKTRATHSIVPY